MDAPAAVLSAICKLPVEVRRRVLFAWCNQRLPHFRNPGSFNEKVNWRILNDRRPLLEWTCDKLAMKEHARGVAGLHLAATLWAGTDLRELATARLPEHWILKPNQRTGLVHFGTDEPDIEQLSEATASWLRPAEAEDLGEWAYSRARPLLLAEEIIGTPGAPPPDYKFFVFDGEVAAVQVDVGRYSTHQRRFYRPDWSPLEVQYGGLPVAPVKPPPAGLHRMLTAACELSAGFEFIRVDLYDIEGEVFFGEFTPYPCSGLARFVPASFDAELGARWTIPEKSRRSEAPGRPTRRRIAAKGQF
jgi:TupA-like ATPgrasp